MPKQEQHNNNNQQVQQLDQRDLLTDIVLKDFLEAKGVVFPSNTNVSDLRIHSYIQPESIYTVFRGFIHTYHAELQGNTQEALTLRTGLQRILEGYFSGKTKDNKATFVSLNPATMLSFYEQMVLYFNDKNKKAVVGITSHVCEKVLEHTVGKEAYEKRHFFLDWEELAFIRQKVTYEIMKLESLLPFGQKEKLEKISSAIAAKLTEEKYYQLDFKKITEKDSAFGYLKNLGAAIGAKLPFAKLKKNTIQKLTSKTSNKELLEFEAFIRDTAIDALEVSAITKKLAKQWHQNKTIAPEEVQAASQARDLQALSFVMQHKPDMLGVNALVEVFGAAVQAGDTRTMMRIAERPEWRGSIGEKHLPKMLQGLGKHEGYRDIIHAFFVQKMDRLVVECIQQLDTETALEVLDKYKGPQTFLAHDSDRQFKQLVWNLAKEKPGRIVELFAADTWEQGKPFFYSAIRNGMTEIVQKLCDKYHWTPENIGSLYTDKSLGDALISALSGNNAAGKNTLTPGLLSALLPAEKNDIIVNILHTAVAKGDKKLVDLLFNKYSFTTREQFQALEHVNFGSDASAMVCGQLLHRCKDLDFSMMGGSQFFMKIVQDWRLMTVALEVVAPNRLPPLQYVSEQQGNERVRGLRIFTPPTVHMTNVVIKDGLLGMMHNALFYKASNGQQAAFWKQTVSLYETKKQNPALFALEQAIFTLLIVAEVPVKAVLFNDKKTPIPSFAGLQELANGIALNVAQQLGNAPEALKQMANALSTLLDGHAKDRTTFAQAYSKAGGTYFQSLYQHQQSSIVLSQAIQKIGAELVTLNFDQLKALAAPVQEQQEQEAPHSKKQSIARTSSAGTLVKAGLKEFGNIYKALADGPLKNAMSLFEKALSENDNAELSGAIEGLKKAMDSNTAPESAAFKKFKDVTARQDFQTILIEAMKGKTPAEVLGTASKSRE